MIKENGNKKQNDGKFFEGRLLCGLALIIIGILIVLFAPDIVFYWIAVGISLIILSRGSYEIWNTHLSYVSNELDRLRVARIEGLTEYAVLMWGYLVGAVATFAFLTTGNNGQGWFLLILAPPGIFDGIAFITGKRIGKHKINALKNISPNKTWEGTIVGVVACISLALIILTVKFSYLEFWQMLVATLVISVCAFFGDLIESKYKRIMTVKDSGTILKGHGGLLDRIDSQLLTAYGMFLLATFWFL